MFIFYKPQSSKYKLFLKLKQKHQLKAKYYRTFTKKKITLLKRTISSVERLISNNRSNNQYVFFFKILNIKTRFVSIRLRRFIISKLRRLVLIKLWVFLGSKYKIFKQAQNARMGKGGGSFFSTKRFLVTGNMVLQTSYCRSNVLFNIIKKLMTNIKFCNTATPRQPVICWLQNLNLTDYKTKTIKLFKNKKSQSLISKRFIRLEIKKTLLSIDTLLTRQKKWMLFCLKYKL